MKTKTRFITFFLSLGAIMMFVACSNPITSPLDKTNDEKTPDDKKPVTSKVLKFNLSGAKAIGAADISASRAIKGLSDYRSIKSALSRATGTDDEFGLVKVKDDGTVEMAMTMPEGIWMPKIMFIAKSPVAGSKDLYVAFEGNINYWDETAKTQVSLGSFLHILEDGTYYSVITKDNGRVKNYSWYGNDNYKPVSFDAQGRMYYVYETWSGSTNTNQIFCYDPVGHTNTTLTPGLGGTYYTNFEVSPDGQRLFVQGERQSGGTNTKFFRMYPISNVEYPVSVYYSSNNQTWVRGYKVSPAGAASQSVILNGYGIRGINGLLKANIISDSSITYEPLFDSTTNQYFRTDYSEWYSDWEMKTYYEGYFDRYNQYDMYIMMTDGTDNFYISLSDLENPYKWQTGLQNINVMKKPEATDWLSQGQVQKELKPNGTSTFGFAIDDVDGKFKVLADPKATDGDGTAATDMQNSSYTIKTYFNNLTAAEKAKLKVFNIQWRNNSNGASSRTKVAAAYDIAVNLMDPLVSTVFAWNDHWMNADKTLKKAEIMTYANKYLMNDAKFKYLTNEAGDASLDAFFAKGSYTSEEINGPAGDPLYFLDNYFVEADGVTKAISFKKYKEDNNLSWLNFQNVGSLFYDGNGCCWAIIGGSMWGGNSSTARPVKILDATGKKTLQFISALNGTTYNPVSYLVSGNRMFFRDGLLDADGYESGYHKMYLLDVTAANPIPSDVLINVPENGRIEIVSFSVSSDTLYFTGVKGTGVIGGKIDLATLAYTPLEDKYMLRNIEVY